MNNEQWMMDNGQRTMINLAENQYSINHQPINH